MDHSLYDHLARFDALCSEAVNLLQQMHSHPRLAKTQLQEFEWQLLELRALACQRVLEILNDAELSNASRIYRKRKRWEKQQKDASG